MRASSLETAVHFRPLCIQKKEIKSCSSGWSLWCQAGEDAIIWCTAWCGSGVYYSSSSLATADKSFVSRELCRGPMEIIEAIKSMFLRHLELLQMNHILSGTMENFKKQLTKAIFQNAKWCLWHDACHIDVMVVSRKDWICLHTSSLLLWHIEDLSD